MRDHQAGPHCWCDPELAEDGIYIHRDMEMSLAEERADEHLRVLEERWAYLSQRIVAKENVGWETVYDRAERDALDWVLFKLSNDSDRDKADVKNAAVEGADSDV